jgi:hypothetical protein
VKEWTRQVIEDIDASACQGRGISVFAMFLAESAAGK